MARWPPRWQARRRDATTQREWRHDRSRAAGATDIHARTRPYLLASGALAACQQACARRAPLPTARAWTPSGARPREGARQQPGGRLGLAAPRRPAEVRARRGAPRPEPVAERAPRRPMHAANKTPPSLPQQGCRAREGGMSAGRSLSCPVCLWQQDTFPVPSTPRPSPTLTLHAPSCPLNRSHTGLRGTRGLPTAGGWRVRAPGHG